RRHRGLRRLLVFAGAIADCPPDHRAQVSRLFPAAEVLSILPHHLRHVVEALSEELAGTLHDQLLAIHLCPPLMKGLPALRSGQPANPLVVASRKATCKKQKNLQRSGSIAEAQNENRRSGSQPYECSRRRARELRFEFPVHPAPSLGQWDS